MPRYETFDVLDDNRLAAFLTREAYDESGIPELGQPPTSSSQSGSSSRTSRWSKTSCSSAAQLDEPFRSIYERYLKALEESRLLTFGPGDRWAVGELEPTRGVPGGARAVCAT